MKKLFTTTLALLLVASLTAQVSFGPRAGFNLTNMNETIEALGMSISLDTDFKPGFQVGLVADIPILGEFLSIQPGLLFAQQGARINNLWGLDINGTININYLQMPINAQFGFGIGENARLLLQAGPYLGFALSGTIKNDDASADIKFGSNDEEMRRFDLGAGFGAGVQFGRLQVGIGYNLGFANLSNEDNTTTRNNGLAFTATWLFGGNR
ncbi:MAG: PorT family protein [Bacteroidales bacterium]|nr:PorT family protein [Bacteroidales bacterium]